MLDLYMTIA